MVCFPYGEDFLASLQDLFIEAGENGRDPGENFLTCREPLIHYLTSCNHMTSAKARACLDLRFTDGALPSTNVQQFPTRVQVDDTATERLRSASSGKEFIAILKALIDEQMEELRPKPGTGKRLKKKKRLAADKLATDNVLKKAKTTVRIKSRRSTQSDLADETEQPPTLDDNKPVEYVVQIMPTDNTDPEEYSRDLTERSKALALGSKLVSSTDPMESVESPGPPRSQSEMDREACSESLRDAVDDQIKNEQCSQGVGNSQVPDLMEGSLQEWGHKTEIDDAETPQIIIHQIIKEVDLVSSSEWENYKPELLKRLSDLENGSSNVAYPTVDRARGASTAVARAVPVLREELDLIPSEAWLKYEAELSKFCANNEVHALHFNDRLHKIVKICYLPEEEVAVTSGNWERLEAMARVCTLLAEMTGSVDEELDRDVLDAWYTSKLRDIQWLKKFYAAKKRLFGAKAPPRIMEEAS
ncbi:Fc.00g060240.m01.CDS01 [Cosmosporella sp. VM-42]